MQALIQANGVAVAVAAVLLALLVAWLIWGRSAKPRQRHRAADVLDEGMAPAQRNQALIDAPSAAARITAPLAASGPDIFGGIGEVVARAAAAEVIAASDTGEATEAAAIAPASPSESAGDDLTRIKGLGPKLAARLAELGITRFDQIAGWDDAALAEIDAQLGNFAGRPARDGWVEQAKFLAAGDTAGFEAKFGKL